MSSWYFSQISRYPLLTPSQEIQLARQVHEGREPAASRARRKLFLSNLRYVVSIAKKYARTLRTMHLDDIIQYGNLGLNRAITSFDPERGYKFATYSRYWIIQSIMVGIGNDEYLIRLPRDKRQQIASAKRAVANLHQKLGRLPTMEEIKELAGVDSSLIELANNIARHPASLDMELEGSGTLVDLIATEGGEDPADDSPIRLLPSLPEDERLVLERYYGLKGQKPKLLSEIATDLGVSRSRAGQIKQRAIRRLRRNYILTLSA